MSKKIHLQLPTPCHADWNKMNSVEKGRFCLSCQKKVIDFTGMTDSEIISFFKKPTSESTCGRFQPTQLNRDILIPRKPWPFVKYFFKFTLPAFLISMKAEAQKKSLNEKIETVRSSEIVGKLAAMPIEDTATPEEVTVKGNVKDENGKPIYYATVMLKGTKTGTVTDTSGNFSLKIKKSPMSQTLAVSSVGFATIEKIINQNTYDAGTIILMQMNQQMLGDIVVVGLIAPRKRRRVGFMEKVISDTVSKCVKLFPVSNSFKIYPNPASPASIITIERKKIVPDDYLIEIINQSGQVVYSEAVVISEAQKISLNVPMIVAGSYFLKLSGKRSGKNYTEKIIIQ